MNLLLRDEIAAILSEEPTLSRDLEDSLPAVVQSQRARAIRRIEHIANSRNWYSAVIAALDESSASYVSDLSDDAVFRLRDRMEKYEECLQTCCDPDDAPPAR